MFQHAYRIGLFFAVTTYIVAGIFVLYFLRHSMNDGLWPLSLVLAAIPAVVIAGMAFVSGWALTVLVLLPKAKNVSRKPLWALLAVAGLAFVGFFALNYQSILRFIEDF